MSRLLLLLDCCTRLRGRVLPKIGKGSGSFFKFIGDPCYRNLGRFSRRDKCAFGVAAHYGVKFLSTTDKRESGL